MKAMRVITHEADSTVPLGMARLIMDGHGFVGTNNGYPLIGNPALFPVAQAEAIAYAWHLLMDKGVQVFPRETPLATVNEFKGLALFDLFPVSEETLRWMDPNKQCL